MSEVDDRLDAIEWMIARWMAESRTSAQLDEELELVLPQIQHLTAPNHTRLFPHFERILVLARKLQRS